MRPNSNFYSAGRYQQDINQSNPLGHGGVIAKAYAQLMTQIWMGKQSSIGPHRLKSLMGEKVTSLFMGFGQHDSQEFMSFLLDAIHEDLNRNKTKPVIVEDQSDDGSDDLCDQSPSLSRAKRKRVTAKLVNKANKLWKQYKSFNDSIIIDLFCGQFKSILTCPDCSKVSNQGLRDHSRLVVLSFVLQRSITFDPFLYVPLPIPPKICYEVAFFARDNATGMCKSAVKFFLKFFRDATVKDLLDVVSSSTNVPIQNMRLVQQSKGSILPKILNPKWLLTDYIHAEANNSASSLVLLVFETYPQCDEYIELCIFQRVMVPVKLDEPQPFKLASIGYPFIVCLRKDALTYSNLCSVLCSYAAFSVNVYNVPIGDDADQYDSQSSLCSTYHSFHLSTFLFERWSTQNGADRSQNSSSASSLSSKDSAVEIPSIDCAMSYEFPHLIYHQSVPSNINDMITPFVLRKATCGRLKSKSAHEDDSDEDEEIVPPTRSCKVKEVSTPEFPQTLNVSSLIGEAEGEELGPVLGNDVDMQEDPPRVGALVHYDNDALLDLENTTFYLAMDWITVKNYSGIPTPAFKVFSDNRNIKEDPSFCSSVYNSNAITLDDCFNAFNEPEVLGPQNCW